MNAAFGKPSQKEEEKPFLLDIAPIGGDPPTEIYLDTFSKVKKLPKGVFWEGFPYLSCLLNNMMQKTL